MPAVVQLTQHEESLMDPLSQAVTGAALAGCFAKKKTMRPALFLGAFGGMAADLDIFIRSATDPLLALEYHRHFTHSIAFSPIGGLLVAGFFWLLLPWIRKNLSFKHAFLFSFLGYFTHGFLDSCTGYGTHLLWPFSMQRESWNIIGIIDLAYTLPALILLHLAIIRKCRDDAMAAMLWMLAYLSLGAFQYYRATEVTRAWLESQNIAHERLTLRPTISNLWLWRVLYKDSENNHWQTHALYLPYWSSEAGIIRGETAPIFDEKMQMEYPADTVTGRDIRRFAFFSNDYLSYHERADGNWWIGDIRYGLTPDSAQPLWGIEPVEGLDNHVIRHRSTRGSLNWYKVENLLKGENFTPIR